MKNFFISQEAPKVKTLRQLSAVAILSLTLAVFAFAGQIETPGATAPPIRTSTSTSTTNVTATSILLTIVDLIYR
jgi:hypothetical protein